MRISNTDHERIAAAVAKAEVSTSAEIRCVLAAETADPRPMSLALAAVFALTLPTFALLLGFKPDALTGLFGAWSVGHLAARDAEIVTALLVYIGLQAALFVAVLGLASLEPLRRALTPKAVVDDRVHRAALEQFAAQGLHRTRDRTGVLLFASLADHRAEVLADEGVYALIPKDEWQAVVAVLVSHLKRGAPIEGYIAAVEKTEALLAGKLPARADDANELPDDLVDVARD